MTPCDSLVNAVAFLASAFRLVNRFDSDEHDRRKLTAVIRFATMRRAAIAEEVRLLQVSARRNRGGISDSSAAQLDAGVAGEVELPMSRALCGREESGAVGVVIL